MDLLRFNVSTIDDSVKWIKAGADLIGGMGNIIGDEENEQQ
jgi:hypothetical protein